MKNLSSVITESMIDNLIEKSKEFVQTKNISECRGFIDNYVERVTVYSNHVEIAFKINIPNADNNDVVPHKSEEDIRILQREYKNNMKKLGI